jgi:hypothetical protein
MRQVIANRWLAKTLLLLPARTHERHRVALSRQYGIDIPPLESHYCDPYSPSPFDLCPIGFFCNAPVANLVVPSKMFIAPQENSPIGCSVAQYESIQIDQH